LISTSACIWRVHGDLKWSLKRALTEDEVEVKQAVAEGQGRVQSGLSEKSS